MSMETRTPPTLPAPAQNPAREGEKRSAVEGIKEASRGLRGTILDELARDSDHFSEQDKQLIKFHGSYQQEDRDARKTRRKEGVGKQYMFMVRCKIPGGRLTAAQYLAVDDLAGLYGNQTMRITTRQGIQLHGVLKSHLRETIAGINSCLLTTLGACGDVERNVMACPAPHLASPVHAQLQETAKLIAAQLAPRTRGYHEIWLNGRPLEHIGLDSQAVSAAHEETAVPGSDDDPLYGKVYLPRKFKTGLALPEDNCIDVYSQDLGLLAVVENGSVAGYNVLVGGGMGMTHGNAHTFPHLARPICYVPARAVVGTAEAVVKLFRDHGNRADRKRARIKYVVHDWGAEKFRSVLSEYVGGELPLPRPIEVTGYDSHLGWNPQGNGKWYYGLSIENGRVKDESGLRLRSGLRKIIETFRPAIRLTPVQDILLCDLEPNARADIEGILVEHGIKRPDEISPMRKLSMACPAVPTCGLALTESERALPAILDSIEAELQRLGMADEKVSVRMTGCPNGCARPYQSDIGLVGRSGDKYTVFVGGTVLGTRLNFQLRDLVPHAEIVNLLTPLLEQFKDHRQSGESFGDFCHRLGVEQCQSLLPDTIGKAKPSHAAEAERSSDVQVVPLSNRLNRRTKPANGDVHEPQIVAVHSDTKSPETPGLVPPLVQVVPIAIPEPKVHVQQDKERGHAPSAPAGKLAMPPKLNDTFLAGMPGEELPDYAYRYNSDGSIRETIVYFYGADQRAENARAGDPLCREAVYVGKADPARLHTARKLSDTRYVGDANHERRDVRLEYDGGGRVARTIVFCYSGDLRASDAPSGSPVRRQVTYEGTLPS